MDEREVATTLNNPSWPRVTPRFVFEGRRNSRTVERERISQTGDTPILGFPRTTYLAS